MTNDKLNKAFNLCKQITSISESIEHLGNISDGVAKSTDQEKIYSIKMECCPRWGRFDLDIGVSPNYVEVLIAIQEVLHKQLKKLELDFDSL